MIHLGPNLIRRETEADRSARCRADAVTKMFGGAAGQSGQRLDFSKSCAPAMPTNGTGSLADLYQPAFRAEIAQRDERAARMDRLPVAVQKLATEGETDLPTLEAVAIIHRMSKTMGGNPVQVFSADVGRAISVTTQRAEEILRSAAQRGWIEARPNHYFRDRL